MAIQWLALLSLLSFVQGSLTVCTATECTKSNPDLLKRHENAALEDLGIPPHRRKHLKKRGIQVAFNRAVAFAPASPHVVSKHIMPVEAVPGTPLSQKYLSQLFDDAITDPFQEEAKSEVIENIRNSVYLTPVTFGGETFKLVIDTGSADTWVAETGFKCLSVLTKLRIDTADCRIAKYRTYNKTSTYKEVQEQRFNISYADGEFLNGRVGMEDVTYAGIKVNQQKFGLVDLAAWNGDTFSSGLSGLAFPSVTRAYNVTDAAKAIRGSNVPYDPLFTSMWKKNLIAPQFTVALNRANEQPGVIALGGLPGPEFKFENEWAKAPLQHLSVSNTAALAANDYQLYVVESQGWDITSARGEKVAKVASTKTKVVIDTGTTLAYLPPAVAESINRAFEPPARLDYFSGQWFVDCNAKAPKAAMKLDGKLLFFDGQDMALRMRDTCLSGIQSTASPLSPSILGGVFMKNIVAVFDIGAAEMRFSNRVR